MNKQNVISIKNLNKIYFKNSSKSINALNNLNLEVKEGEIFGLLGPNGAGKSTFINILAGTTVKSSGEVNVWGFDLDRNPRQVKASIGIVPQEVNVDPFFTPEELPDNKYYIFGKDGGRDLAKSLDVPLLGQIPLVQSVRESGDAGRPAVLQQGTSSKDAFMAMCENVVERLEWRNKNIDPTKVVPVEYGEPKCSS